MSDDLGLQIRIALVANTIHWASVGLINDASLPNFSQMNEGPLEPEKK